MEIRVLGPVEVVGDDDRVPPAAEKQRRLLAALASHLGDTRSTDLLIDAVWGAYPPASAAKLLQVYVSQLRKLLPAARIRRRGAGYALELDGESLDATQFERLVQEGKAAFRDGNPALAASLLRRALGLWRGQAYGDFAYEEFARAEAERLEELRLAAVEGRIEADLALGRHTDLLPELRGLASEHPLRERLQAQAMLALYRSGRQSEALDVYAALRGRLHDELGLEPSDELRELQRRILQHNPELAHAAAPEAASALPAPPNPLLGRERELGELRALLLREEVRLLVLTGAGGSGKTRLALEAARETAASFANGAALVALAPLRDPALVLGAISQAVGAAKQSGDSLETLADALRPRELLVVLDNVEHLRRAAPIFVELLARAPRLTLLVTSRVVLHLSGEQVYPVEPLPAEAAAALFLERARAADPHFEPTVPDEDAIQQICLRLDGLPLAVELAASRVRTVTPVELLARLEPRLPLLAGGLRDLPARQQTLRATLDWSFELLDEEEHRALCRLSVFAGGFTLQAAEAVGGVTLERLSSLVDHSLLSRTTTARGSRYSMLETIREYGAELLESSADADTIRRRHAEHMLAVAKSANLAVDSQGNQRYEVVIAEQDNARAALAWALESGEIELGLELALALENFWVTHDPREGMRWFDSLLAVSRDLPLRLRMHALRACGGSSMFVDEERARRLQEEALACARELRDDHATVLLLLPLAELALLRGDVDEARRFATETLQLNRRVGSRQRDAQGLSLLGDIARREGDPERARGLFEQSLAGARETGFRWWEMQTLLALASVERELGRLDEAKGRAKEALTLAREIGDDTATIVSVAALARLARDSGRVDRAGRLWGAVEAAEAARPEIAWAIDRPGWETAVVGDGRPEFERAREQGRALTLDEAVEYALDS